MATKKAMKVKISLIHWNVVDILTHRVSKEESKLENKDSKQRYSLKL